MLYKLKNYDALLGISGLSENLLKNHFTLYQGYVTNTNKLLESLATFLHEGKMATPEYSELKRRFGWEFNGMRLHEYYFENMVKGGGNLDKNSTLFGEIGTQFGSFENWEKDFKATGTMRGIGWVVLYFDQKMDRLLNIWVNEHDVGHLSGATPILIMDVFEHAYMLDYGLKKADYIEAFFKAIDWEVTKKRFDKNLV